MLLEMQTHNSATASLECFKFSKNFFWGRGGGGGGGFFFTLLITLSQRVCYIPTLTLVCFNTK